MGGGGRGGRGRVREGGSFCTDQSAAAFREKGPIVPDRSRQFVLSVPVLTPSPLLPILLMANDCNCLQRQISSLEKLKLFTAG